MKKYLLSVTALLVALSAQAAVYTGASAAYMFGDEEVMYLARVGTSFGQTGNLTHHVELEAGYYEVDADFSSFEIEIDLIPVMANYRLSIAVADPLSLYVGAGIGATRFKESVHGSFGGSYSDTLFTMQTLIGAEYAFNQSFSALLGFRYMWWHNLENYDDEGIDDIAVEAGFVVRF